MKKIIFVVLILILIYSITNLLPPQGYEIVVNGLDTPWAIDFLPDDTMIFTERGGRVSVLDEGVRVIANIEVSEVSESGLSGIAVDPDFEENRFVYVYYTHSSGNRISRFVFNEKLEEETILLDNIPSARFHDGGRIKFGPDGLLYITTGDATDPSSAQDIDSLSGKILRMNKDGSVPDNPFGNYVYSYGHRNPQGIAWRGDVMYSAEHGPTRNDEVNIIEKGGNYGWPIVQCDETSEYIDPIRCFSEFTLAPGGTAIHENDLYVTGLRGSQVRKIGLDDGKEEELFSELGRIRDVVVHNGYIYIATSNRDGRGVPRVNDDKIVRFKV